MQLNAASVSSLIVTSNAPSLWRLLSGSLGAAPSIPSGAPLIAVSSGSSTAT